MNDAANVTSAAGALYVREGKRSTRPAVVQFLVEAVDKMANSPAVIEISSTAAHSFHELLNGTLFRLVRPCACWLRRPCRRRLSHCTISRL